MDRQPPIRVLFFDVFGTCVAQRKPAADALSGAAKEALAADKSLISPEVRAKGLKWTYDNWFDFGGAWDREVDRFVKKSIAETRAVNWKDVDKYRVTALKNMLADRGLLLLNDSDAATGPVQAGSLWTEDELHDLARNWHRLPPWSDTCQGLTLLNTKFSTVTLSNTYQELMEGLVAHSSIPFTKVFTSELFDSYKPNPKVYLGAAEKMGVKPDECALVAAHLGDLKAAKACRFRAIYVERPLEEKAPELLKEDIPDLWIKEEENGFVALAERLGIKAD